MSLCRMCYNLCLKKSLCYNICLQKKKIVEAEKIIFFKIKIVIRIQQESKTYLMSIFNSWSVFQEGGIKFDPLEARLHIVDFS